jgi:hypothetical protein
MDPSRKYALLILIVLFLFFSGLSEADDYGDSCGTAYTINLFTSGLSGSISSYTDYDYFKVYIPVAGLWTVYTTGSTDVKGAIYDHNCSELASNDDCSGSNENFCINNYPISSSGYYYIMVTGRLLATGPYVLVSNYVYTAKPASPVIGKSFNSAGIALGGAANLSFTIHNQDPYQTLTGLAFTDNLPAGLVVTTPNGLTGSCGGGTITAAPGSNQISLAGASLALNSSCTFSVKITGVTSGVKNNSVTVTSANGGTGNTAYASATVLGPPELSAYFSPNIIALDGTTALYFIIENPASNPSALTGIAFTDTIPAGIVVATPNGLSGNCEGVITATAGSNVISLSGGALSTNHSCGFSINVKGVAYGSILNQTGAISSANGGAGSTASATLTVGPSLTVIKAGSGGGTVSTDTGFLTWNGNTGSGIFAQNTSLNLSAAPDANSAFAGWSDACSGNSNACSIVMDSPKSVTATFSACGPDLFRIGGGIYSYPNIQSAYNAMGSGIMQIQGLVYSGGLTLDQGKTVTLQGGYGCDFTSNPVYTTISDKLTIKDGKVTVERLIIK